MPSKFQQWMGHVYLVFVSSLKNVIDGFDFYCICCRSIKSLTFSRPGQISIIGIRSGNSVTYTLVIDDFQLSNYVTDNDG